MRAVGGPSWALARSWPRAPWGEGTSTRRSRPPPGAAQLALIVWETSIPHGTVATPRRGLASFYVSVFSAGGEDAARHGTPTSWAGWCRLPAGSPATTSRARAQPADLTGLGERLRAAWPVARSTPTGASLRRPGIR